MFDRRDFVNDEDYEMVRRVGPDCIPPVRRTVLEYLCTGEDEKFVKLYPSTQSYAVEDLRAQGLVKGRGDHLDLSQKGQGLAIRAGLFG
jgi:hypothetical protein